ncbi:MAG: hypothetical protein AB7T49_01555 [Oligoflexales bacterium]
MILRRIVRTLKNRYFIGLHWGRYHKNVKVADWVDFNMAGPGTVTFVTDTFFIPLCSRNFLPNIFTPERKVKRYWDILSVGRNIREKKFETLLREIRKIYDTGRRYNVLLVIPSSKLEDTDDAKFATGLIDLYYDLFSDEERQHVCLMKIDWKVGMYGLPRLTLAWIYKNSKVFTLLTQEEGESRVIAEALLARNTVVVKSDLRGGGLDYLSSSNSVTFDDYNDCYKTLIKAVEEYESRPEAEISDELLEEHSIKKLKGYFATFYKEHGLPFDENLINTNNLDMRLASHYWDKNIAWGKPLSKKFLPNDLTTISSFFEFRNYLLKNQVS